MTYKARGFELGNFNPACTNENCTQLLEGECKLALALLDLARNIGNPSFTINMQKATFTQTISNYKDHPLALCRKGEDVALTNAAKISYIVMAEMTE